MVWAPKFQAVFAEQAVTNVIALVDRDFKTALDYFYAAEDYPVFAEVALGQVLGNEFPGLGINPSMQIEESDDGAQLLETIVIELYLGVIDDGPDTVTRRLMRYIRCLDSVFRTEAVKRNQALFLSGFPTGKFVGLVVSVDHAYGPLRSNGSVLYRDAQVNLTIQIREVTG